ncbi:Highly reducing polyketide synthase ACRTS2 [Apiospora arundinis]
MEQPPLAIIGYAYRAPGVGRKGLWEFLKEAKSAWSPIPPERFKQDAFYHPDPEKCGSFTSKGGHFLPDDIYAFDAAFFNLKADEARVVDPQHRLLLECAFEAAESAGLTLSDLWRQNIAVFSAHDSSEYTTGILEDTATTNKYAGIGIPPAMVANRLSYFFGLTGPSVALDAACAGSSYAMHQACQSIWAGNCSAAFVGGSSLLIRPEIWTLLDSLGALSPDGKCYSYDAKANGFGRGEGGACLIIKPLSDALAAGDPVRAIIRNISAAHTGRTPGISLPSQSSQEELLLRVHSEIGLDPKDTTFIEGHGTGTIAGDSIDGNAIAVVAASQRTSGTPLHIGSLKSNFGHLEGSSGVLSTIKAVMMLEHGMLLPNANFETLNPKIEHADKLRVLTKAISWPPGSPKRVCVTNYGMGGSIAATLLDEAPTKALSCLDGSLCQNGHTNSNGQVNRYDASIKRDTTNSTANHNGNSHTECDTKSTYRANGLPQPLGKSERLYVFSAKSAASLQSYCPVFADYLSKLPESAELADDLCYTLTEKRTLFNHRAAVIAGSFSSLRDQLMDTSAVAKGTSIKSPAVAFVFTGQGAQYFQMAAGLERYEVFGRAIAEAEKLLKGFGSPWSLTGELSKPCDVSRIDDPQISQPACTAVQLALVALLRSWGISPRAVAGHSSGEIAAAYAAGLLSFEAAVGISYYRGVAVSRLVQDASSNGAMLALGVGATEATQLIKGCGGYAVIAAYNSPESVTLSGDADAIAAIEEEAKRQSLFVRKLKVNVAYHSAHMNKAADSYMATIEPLCVGMGQKLDHEPKTQPIFFSSVTGKRETTAPTTATYWVKNLVSPVLYMQALGSLTGPSATDDQLVTSQVLVEQPPRLAKRRPRIFLRYCEGADATLSMLQLATKLFVSGASIKIGEVNGIRGSSRVVTDLPPYEWMKATRHFLQSRITTQKLHHVTAYNCLLGRKSPSEGNVHTFRNVFSTKEMPWVRDHEVDGQVLFPFTGFSALATEAFKTVFPGDLQTILIQEIHVTKSLRVEDEQMVDMTTNIRPAREGTSTSSQTTWEFEISTWTDAQGWTVHAFGRIKADDSEALLSSPSVRAAHAVLKDTSLIERDVSKEYAELEQAGIRYGPDFSRMVHLRSSSRASVHTISIRDWNQEDSAKESPVTTDPPTLDAILHCFSILQGASGARAMYVPTQIRRWHISNRIPAGPRGKLHVVTQLVDCEPKTGTMHLNIVVFDMSGRVPKPVIDADTITFKAISKPRNQDMARDLPATYDTIYVPAVDLVDTMVPSSMVESSVALSSEDQERETRYRQTVYDVVHHFLSKMLQETKNDDKRDLPPHLREFYEWANECVRQFPLHSKAFDLDAYLSQKDQQNAMDQMICAVGLRLTDIMRGKIQPLELMLADGLLSRSYEQDTESVRMNKGLATYVQHLAQNNPDLKILEIGGGTASAAVPIFKAIQKATEGTTSNFQYMFTDISSGFFEDAEKKLKEWSENDRISYKKLDIGKDPAAQGFKLHSYDLVVAANVLHATPNIDVTLQNARSLLKDDGKLALLELTQSVIPATLPFALLPGWWLFEDRRRSPNGPLLSAAGWEGALKSSGFSGVDGRVADRPGQSDENYAVMWSTAVPKAGGSFAQGVKYAVLTDGVTQGTLGFSRALERAIESDLGVPCISRTLHQGCPDEQTFCIILDNPKQSIFRSLSPEYFDGIKDVMLRSRGVLWVSPEEAEPEASLVKGFLRGLRIEDGSKCLLLFENVPYTELDIGSILNVAQRMLSPNPAVRRDQEFAVIDGLIRVPRLRVQPAAADAFAADAGVLVKQEQRLGDGGVGLQMTVESVGDPDSLYMRCTDTLAAVPTGEQVVVRVEAAGVNFRDLLFVLGSLPFENPGMEGAGVVVGVGPQVEDVKIGDRVLFQVDDGAWSTFVKTDAGRVHKLPDGLDAAEAAGMPVVHCTAIVSLIEVGRLRKGESVLIHAASGVWGKPASCSRSTSEPEKRDFIKRKFGIPPSQIFSSRTSAFRNSIMLATDGRGVDVIVNSLSGHLLQQSWELIADNGRFIELGKMDFKQNNYLPMGLFAKNVTFCGLDMWKRWNTVPGSTKADLKMMLQLLQEGTIEPIRPLTKLSITKAAAGLRKLQSGQSVGKIVLTVDADDVVVAERPSTLSSTSGTLLRPDRTYVISGGTGGLGRSLATWMVEQGAKNIVLLGRSGSSSPEVARLLEHYKGTNVCLRAVACDVASREDVMHASQAIADLPRVAGVIHGALYLRDAFLMNSTFDHWKETTEPKIRGAWLLHETFDELDFFVSLSSVDGIVGHHGQSIYSATCTFLDAFAQHRLRLGMPAVTISLPAVEGAGYAHDRNLNEMLNETIGLKLREDQVHTVLKAAILGPSSGLVYDGRIVTAVNSRAEGAELPYDGYRFLSALRPLKRGAGEAVGDGQGSGSKAQGDWKDGSPEGLMNALTNKVATITMMDIEEVTPERELDDYGLDSLISVELRNWIKRESGVDLPLNAIVEAENLQALADDILSRMKD